MKTQVLTDLIARILSEANILPHRIYIWLIQHMKTLLTENLIDSATPEEMYEIAFILFENLLFDCQISNWQREVISNHVRREMQFMLRGSYDEDDAA